MTDYRRPTGQTTPSAQASRQWEAELLVSGIAVFAMMQLPGILDDAIFSLRPRFDATWSSLLLLLYVYGKSAAVLLAATFTIHLLLRARWIALAGMHAIYPQGVDWPRLRIGAIAREEEQVRMGRIEDAVVRADHRATIVFTIGVMLASVLVALFALVAIFLGIPMLVLSRFGIVFDTGLVMLIVLLGMVPFFLAHTIDIHGGKRLAPGGRADRSIRATYAFFRRLGVSPASNPALALLNSQLGPRRMVFATMAIIMVPAIGVTLGYAAMRSDTPLGNYERFPKDVPAGRRAAAAFYDDQRDPARDRPTPYIASAVAEGPYLRVVVPYDPERVGPVAARCPAAGAPSAAADDGLAGLSCLASLHVLSIDGNAMDANYDATTDARTGRPALLAMLDIRRLPPGRHVLGVTRPPRHDRHGTPLDGDEDPDVGIPFWR